MPKFIKECFIYKILMGIVLSYENSIFKRVWDKVTIFYKESFIGRNIEKYLNKKPYFLNSITYKIVLKFIKLIDKVMGFFGNIYMGALNNSCIIKTAKSTPEYGILKTLFIFLTTFTISYTFFGILVQNINYLSILILILLDLALLLLSTQVYLKKSWENSLMVNLVKYFFD